MTADNPYSGAVGEHIVKYQAGAIEQASTWCADAIAGGPAE